METRCRKCIFKDIDGGKHPCNECAEIINFKRYKHGDNYFEPIDEDKNTEFEKRLKEKLNEIVVSTGKKIIYKEYKIMEDKNMKLTAFLNYGNDIAIYQIIDTGEELIENVVSVEKELLDRIRTMW